MLRESIPLLWCLSACSVGEEPITPEEAGEGAAEPGQGVPQGLSNSKRPAGKIASLRFGTADEKFDALGRSEENGSALKPLVGFTQFWFAWAAFNDGGKVFGHTEPVETWALEPSSKCAVPCDEILPGGPPKDGIPALTRPKMVAANSADAAYIADNSFVVGVAVGQDVRAYPHNLFWHHEIINDEVGGTPLSITHCPLTFSTITYDPKSFNQGKTVELGVSGKLFQSNLVFYNREDDTYFSQLFGVGVKGPLKDHVPKRVPVFEMNWAAWKALYPETQVASENTGHARTYTNYPYGRLDYFTDPANTWGTGNPDDRYPAKEPTYAVFVDGKTKAYAHSELRAWAKKEYGSKGKQRGVLNDRVGKTSMAIVFDLDAAYVQAFDREELPELELEMERE